MSTCSKSPYTCWKENWISVYLSLDFYLYLVYINVSKNFLLTKMVLTQLTASESRLLAAQWRGVFPSTSGIPMLESWEKKTSWNLSIVFGLLSVFLITIHKFHSGYNKNLKGQGMCWLFGFIAGTCMSIYMWYNNSIITLFIINMFSPN